MFDSTTAGDTGKIVVRVDLHDTLPGSPRRKVTTSAARTGGIVQLAELQNTSAYERIWGEL